MYYVNHLDLVWLYMCDVAFDTRTLEISIQELHVAYITTDNITPIAAHTSIRRKRVPLVFTTNISIWKKDTFYKHYDTFSFVN